jgi:Family of unknown function (DUF6223)
VSVHHLLAAALLAQPTTVTAYTMTAGRLWSLVGVVLGVTGVVVGGLALARHAGRSRRRTAVAALVAGLAGAVVGAFVVAAAEGGPGTGYGVVGGWVALVVGVIAAVLGGLAIATDRASARRR